MISKFLVLLIPLANSDVSDHLNKYVNIMNIVLNIFKGYNLLFNILIKLINLG